jgi:hypothetical protein
MRIPLLKRFKKARSVRHNGYADKRYKSHDPRTPRSRKEETLVDGNRPVQGMIGRTLCKTLK